MTYRVTAPLVLARDKEGKVHHVYQNGVINWLPEDQKAHFLDVGLVEKVSGSPAVEDDDDSGDGVPLRAAPKAEWVDYAISKGADSEEAEASTKAELIELYGG